MGCSKESTGDELRQIEQIVEVLLREGYNAEGSGRKIQNGVRSQSISGKISSSNDVSDISKHPTAGYGDAVLAMYSNTAAG